MQICINYQLQLVEFLNVPVAIIELADQSWTIYDDEHPTQM